MSKLINISCLLFLCHLTCSASKTETASKPNVIYILADDLGYGELGCYGQERIETPNIDALAKNGMLFSQHYSGSPVCAPSRCVLLTGKHTGHSYIRGNDEWTSRGNVGNYRAMLADSTLEGQRPLLKDTKTIGKLLQAQGYTTGAVGKWGLGAPHTEGIPNKQGFDFFCGYNCQRQAHTYYPVHLYLNENRIYLDNDTVPIHSKLNKGADPLALESYAKFSLKEYAPDVMFREMMHFVDENKNNPFFLYWATPIPHVAIQAPQKWVDYYVDKFGDEKPYLGNKGYFPHRYPHAGYAAMISYLDEQVGQLVQYLKENGLYDNTLIIFTSDNGPTFNGGSDSPWFNSGGQFNEEYGWGKCFLQEGGIRVPMIASWPGKIKAGTRSQHISAFYDVLPTLCELTGAKVPTDIDGISFLPELLGDKQKEHGYLYWEYPEMQGQQAVRFGKWKAIRKQIKKGNRELELYNLETDIREENNVAKQYPEQVKKAEQLMIEAHTPAKLRRFKMKQLGD
ncbi:N-acetylgalactosamine-6-sulfatase [Puteibacter caeruleilacunae]|nr:N-acetylgalactosamine-6-sulfatase [Puteibacter caeruleilacunae]